MKRLALFLFSLLICFAGGYFLPRFYPHNDKELPQPIAEGRFLPAPYPIQNHPFALVIIGRNNGASVEKTLESAFSQKYENMRFLYIDDASDDGSFELARDLIYDSGRLGETTLVRNEQQLGHAANLYRAAQSCADGEIIVVLDGDDRLAHEWVLQRLNQYYADPDLWLAYSEYREFPTFRIGQSRLVGEKDSFRGIPNRPYHLKSFYAALFKKIREQDLVYQGQFFPASAELAYMVPLLEMAKDHLQFIPEVLYLSTGVAKEDRELKARCESHIRSLTPYDPVLALTQIPEMEIEAGGAQ